MSRVLDCHPVRVASAGSSVPDDDVLHPPTWNRPAPERHGDIDVDDIYVAVGRALSEWSMVETEHSATCRRVIEAAGLAAQRRDDVVHGIAVLFRPGALDGSYLVPTGFTAGDSNAPDYAYTAAQITTLRSRFGRLQDEINLLILRLQVADGH